MRRNANENVNNPSPEEWAEIEMRKAKIRLEGMDKASTKKRGTYDVARKGKCHMTRKIRKGTPE